MVLVLDLKTIYDNVGGMKFIQAPSSCICIDAKLLVEDNGVVLEKVTYSSQLRVVQGSNVDKDSNPQLPQGLEEGYLDFFLENNKEYSKG